MNKKLLSNLFEFQEFKNQLAMECDSTAKFQVEDMSVPEYYPFVLVYTWFENQNNFETFEYQYVYLTDFMYLKK